MNTPQMDEALTLNKGLDPTRITSNGIKFRAEVFMDCDECYGWTPVDFLKREYFTYEAAKTAIEEYRDRVRASQKKLDEQKKLEDAWKVVE